MEVIKTEEAKYRKVYDAKKDEKDKNWVLDGLKADSFKIAITKLEAVGLKETYKYFKEQKDEHSNSFDKLGANMAHAYGLVVGKLWKFVSKL